MPLNKTKLKKTSTSISTLFVKTSRKVYVEHLSWIFKGGTKSIMKKRILLISQNFYPEIGSAGNRIKNIFQLLKNRNYDVSVLTTEPTYPNRELYKDSNFWDEDSLNNEENIHRITVNNRRYAQTILNRLIYYLEIAFKLIMFILKDDKKYDVIFVSTPPIFIGLVGIIAKKKYKSKLILDVRDLWPESLKGVDIFNNKLIISIFELIEKKIYEQSNYIIINSLGFLSHISIKNKIPVEKISFIPNGARESEIISQKIRSKSFNVIYAGNIGLAQDSILLMEIAKELRKHNITISVISYGLKKKNFAEFVTKHNLDNVRIIPPLSRKECLKFISNHQVGIVTLNDSEVFNTVLPGKIIDYMTCRVPVVAAVSGYSKEVIETEQVGFVSVNRDKNEMVNYILEMKNNPALIEKLADNCTNYVKDFFQWEKNIEKLIQIVERNL
jgi:glycosyltransferase involved in cell wall biosynthesis